jgi:NADH-quinone oxidoreductase subunit L
MNELFPWILLFLPLASAVCITLFTQRQRGLSASLSIGAIVVGFILSAIIFLQTGAETVKLAGLSFEWLSVGDLKVDFGVTLDPLSKLMLLIVTGVGSAIHIYSWGYMHDDPGVSRYFASLSLFTFSMLGIVLSNNLLQMFIFGSWSAFPVIC